MSCIFLFAIISTTLVISITMAIIIIVVIRKLGLHTWYDLIYHDITADHFTQGNERNSEMTSSKKDEVVRCVDNIYDWNEQLNKYTHIYIYIYIYIYVCRHLHVNLFLDLCIGLLGSLCVNDSPTCLSHCTGFARSRACASS